MVVPAISMSSSGDAVRQELHRWLVAQQFLDQADDQVGFAAQPLEHVGVAQQGEHAVGDEVDGGLVAGEQQQRGGGHQLLARHPALRAVVGDQPGEQVVAWVVAPGVGEPGEVLAQFGEGLRRSGGAAPQRSRRLASMASTIASAQTWKRGSSSRGTPSSRQITVTGKRVGEVVDEVAPGSCRRSRRSGPVTISTSSGCMPSIRSGVCGGPNCRIARRRSRSCSGGSSADEAAQHCRASSAAAPASWAAGAVAAVRADPRVVQQRVDLPVGADHVGAVGLPRHRGLAQLGVERVGVGTVGVVEDLREDARALPSASPPWFADGCGVFEPMSVGQQPRAPFARVVAGDHDGGVAGWGSAGRGTRPGPGPSRPAGRRCGRRRERRRPARSVVRRTPATSPWLKVTAATIRPL